MTIRKKSSSSKAAAKNRRWPLAMAKGKLSEIVRQAQEQGPQIITSHGKDVAEVRRLDLKASKSTGTLFDFFARCAKRKFEEGDLVLPERAPVTHREFSFDD